MRAAFSLNPYHLTKKQKAEIERARALNLKEGDRGGATPLRSLGKIYVYAANLSNELRSRSGKDVYYKTPFSGDCHSFDCSSLKVLNDVGAVYGLFKEDLPSRPDHLQLPICATNQRVEGAPS